MIELKITSSKKIIIFEIFILIFVTFASCKSKKINSNKKIDEPKIKETKILEEPEKLSIFKKAYPDVNFISEWQEDKNDWKITIIVDEKKTELYWNNGSLIPETELSEKEKYWTLLYNYNYRKNLEDPANFTNEQIEAMKKFGSDENRRNGAGTPMFFFDAIYDSTSREKLENHIISIKFLGFKVNVHQRMKIPLQKVENKINELAQTDSEISDFLKSLGKNEGYFWRVIANTNRKSFHSLGIAIDIQPKYYGRKEVYWSWAKDKNPENWMLTPLKDRWMPPQKIIDIFEDEGFIWGGKWAIWDNMHFEYHPELILNAKENERNLYSSLP